MYRLRSAPLSLLGILSLAACDGGLVMDDDDPGMCPTQLPEAEIACTDASCNATTGTKTWAQADLAGDESASWLTVSWVSSDLFDNEIVNVSYQKAASGALLAKRARERRRLAASKRHAPQEYEALYAPRVEGRIRAEALLRSEWPTEPVDVNRRGATGIAGRSAEVLPEGVHRQDMACSRSAPTCPEAMICVLETGNSGTCQGSVTIKFRAGGQNVDIDATVRKVGTYGAILVDQADTVQDADVDEVLKRFDEHIAPIDHALFGEPKTMAGEDFDGNGVTLLLLTSKVGDISPDLVGFFYAPDMEDPAQNPDSNGADLLYMQPPGGDITIDALSGTIAHEYQHVINFLAKSSRGSTPEAVWLDEGLSGFAEDITGYGADAFTNISRYLDAVSETSLTGFGLLYDNAQDADSAERRGIAHLFLRIMFERSGGATLGDGPGQLTDGGGAAQIKKLVQNANTGVDVINQANTTKSLHEWLGIHMKTVALDGTMHADVSCNPDFQLADPETSAYTGGQVGIDLRGSFTNFQGTNVSLKGPATATFENEEVPVPVNGGEVRTVAVPNGTVNVGVGGPAEDYQLGLSAIPVGG